MAALTTRDQGPLAGVVVCCTDILAERRHELALMAKEMGADHKYDLTSDVTHLIIGSVTTDKYAYVAKERPDVKVLLETFVEDVRNLWMSGAEHSEGDIEALEEKHKAPTFFNLKICLTGFEELSKREEIKRIVEEGGARYHPDLTKDVTHLVVAVAQGKKYDYARKWGINVVSERWLDDSVERGLVLREQLYDPILPLAEQGTNAWKRQIRDGSFSLGKRQRQDESRAANKRKMRRTMSAKLGSNSESLWADIATVEPITKQQQDDFVDAGNDSTYNADPSSATARNQSEATPDDDVDLTKALRYKPSREDAPPQGIFSGVVLLLYGFSGQKLALLSHHASLNGAGLRVLNSVTDLHGMVEESTRTLLLVPHDMSKTKSAAMGLERLSIPVVTEWWLESCLHRKKMIDPQLDRFSKPFQNLRVDGFEGLTVCCTGFKDMDLLHLSKTVTLMGATFDEFLKPTASVLVCGESEVTSKKLDFAWGQGIPAVSVDWLFACVESGTIQSYSPFEVKNASTAASNEAVRKQRSREASITRRSTAGSPAQTTKTTKRRLGGQLELSRQPSVLTPGRRQKEATVPLDKESSSRPRLRELSQGEMNMPSPSPPKPSPSRSKKRPGASIADSENAESVIPSCDPDVTRVEMDNVAVELPSFDGAGSAPENRSIPQENQAAQGRSEDQSPLPDAAARSKEELNMSIAALLAAKEASLARRASDPTGHEQPIKRKRTLGRALSSNSLVASAASSLKSGNVPAPDPKPARAVSPVDEESMTFTQRWLAENGDAEGADSRTTQGGASEEPMPSQGLIYEDDAMREQKAKLLRRLGGRVEEKTSPTKGSKGGGLQNATFTNPSGVGTRRKGRRF